MGWMTQVEENIDFVKISENWKRFHFWKTFLEKVKILLFILCKGSPNIPSLKPLSKNIKAAVSCIKKLFKMCEQVLILWKIFGSQK